MLSIPASTSNHGAIKPPGAQEVVLSISVSNGTSEFTYLHQSVKQAIDCCGFLGPLFCFVFALTLVSFLPSSVPCFGSSFFLFECSFVWFLYLSSLACLRPSLSVYLFVSLLVSIIYIARLLLLLFDLCCSLLVLISVIFCGPHCLPGNQAPVERGRIMNAAARL